MAWHDFAPHYFPLPHPSPRNQPWFRRNPWFDEHLLPDLRDRINAVLPASALL